MTRAVGFDAWPCPNCAGGSDSTHYVVESSKHPCRRDRGSIACRRRQVWNQKFIVPLPEDAYEFIETTKLNMVVWDHDLGGMGNDFWGQVTLDLSKSPGLLAKSGIVDHEDMFLEVCSLPPRTPPLSRGFGQLSVCLPPSVAAADQQKDRSGEGGSGGQHFFPVAQERESQAEGKEHDEGRLVLFLHGSTGPIKREWACRSKIGFVLDRKGGGDGGGRGYIATSARHYMGVPPQAPPTFLAL